MKLSNLADFLERFRNIAVINNEVLSNYGFFHSAAICNNIDETSNSMPTSEFYELFEEMNKNNVKLLDKHDFFISKVASESQMLKMKLDMQLNSDNSTTTYESNTNTALYGISISMC